VLSRLGWLDGTQVITGSHDSTIKLWDLAAGKAMTTLTHHKKSVRAMCMHPTEFTFASASADNIKKFVLPRGNFLHNMLSNQRTILNSMAVNQDGIMATGGDNGRCVDRPRMLPRGADR
jgi:pleiotropic regulator 1